MKKVVLGLILVLVVGWIVLWFVSNRAWSNATAQTWPAGLGPASSVPKRFPKTERNLAADRLIVLAAPLDVDFRPRAQVQADELPSRETFEALRDSMSTYLDAQVARRGDAIDELPVDLAAYLGSHGAELDAVRDHLIAQPVHWETRLAVDAPIPNLVAHMDLQRLLTTRAFSRARAGDAGAWTDLHAAWRLAGGLVERPDMISQLIGLAVSRRVNAAARKMPLPEPAWMTELRAFDFETAMAGAVQAEAWVMGKAIQDASFKDVESSVASLLMHVSRGIGAPYFRFCAADTMNFIRRTASAAHAKNICDYDGLLKTSPAELARWNAPGNIGVPNLQNVWHRVFRFRAEREVTAKVLQIRRGETPSAASVCTDRTWTFEGGALRIDKDIPVTESEQKAKVPLEY